MDTVDVKILRMLMMGGGSFLGNDARRPYRMIAGKLQVTEDTVRNRIEKFREEGFIRGWKLGINPTLFGRQAAFLLFDVRPPSSSTKEDVIRKIKLIDGVLFILCYFGNFLGIHITGKSEEALKKKTELIARISNSESLISMKISFPPSSGVRLTQTDWALIKCLRKNPRKPFGVIARELGISPRTARRRTEGMVQGGVIYTLPDVDIKGLQGGVSSSLSVFYSDPKLAQKVAAKIIPQFEQYLTLFHTADREHNWFGFILPNIAKANEIEKWVRGLDGVQGTSMRLVEDFVNLVDEAFADEMGQKAGMARAPQEIRAH